MRLEDRKTRFSALRTLLFPALWRWSHIGPSQKSKGRRTITTSTFRSLISWRMKCFLKHLENIKAFLTSEHETIGTHASLAMRWFIDSELEWQTTQRYTIMWISLRLSTLNRLKIAVRHQVTNSPKSTNGWMTVHRIITKGQISARHRPSENKTSVHSKVWYTTFTKRCTICLTLDPIWHGHGTPTTVEPVLDQCVEVSNRKYIMPITDRRRPMPALKSMNHLASR